MGQTINPFGKKIISRETEFCGRTLKLETGRVAFQSAGVVTVTYGDTVVFGVVNVSDGPIPGLDFFPLSVDYEERFYAAGKISGSRFIKREGRPTDDAILAGRLIDRPIRPLFPKGYHNEVQAVAVVQSLDPELKSDIVAMIAVSTAMMLSGAPFEGPVAGVRMGLINDKLVAFPTNTELETSKLDLIVAGTSDAIMMVEAGASEVSEEIVLEGIKAAHEAYQPIIKLINAFVKEVGVEAKPYELAKPNEDIQKEVAKWSDGKLGKTIQGGHLDRKNALKTLENEFRAAFSEKLGEEEWQKHHKTYLEAFDIEVKTDIRRAILEDKTRPDGRKPNEIRQLSSEVGVLPRAHGSSIFTRGTTQALNVTTLAPLSYVQLIDSMEGEREKRFFHHYNMPGYSNGEIKRLGSPGRREIGHSALAERAVQAIIPAEADFPYTIRCVTEILSSNGSTSMAATCSTVLSLMNAGVPIKAPVSGIAMGLVTDGKGGYVILADIMGAEDFAGDMDFKVAGTSEGITALQMDIKVKGITPEVMGEALQEAKGGRAHILKHMLETIAKPGEMSPYAPRVEAITVNPDKIREIIGKGGETIQRITAETGTEIDIKDDGIVMISSPNKENIEAAKKWIKGITDDPEVGAIYENCRVVSVLDFGAFVEIMPGKEGLVHISEMSDKRVEKTSDIVSEGDMVTVKLMAIDERGRLVLSMREVKQK